MNPISFKRYLFPPDGWCQSNGNSSLIGRSEPKPDRR